MSTPEHRNGACGPNCRYRPLYEGSQASLNDMARRQAEALARAGRLRNGMVLTLRRNYSRAFAQAEQALGHRLSDVDDEVLLAYMGDLLASAPQAAPAGLGELRAALEDAGIPLPPSSDLLEWSTSIRTYGPGAGEPLDADLAALFADLATPEAPAPAEAPKRRTLQDLRRETQVLATSIEDAGPEDAPSAAPAPAPAPVRAEAAVRDDSSRAPAPQPAPGAGRVNDGDDAGEAPLDGPRSKRSRRRRGKKPSDVDTSNALKDAAAALERATPGTTAAPEPTPSRRPRLSDIRDAAPSRGVQEEVSTPSSSVPAEAAEQAAVPSVPAPEPAAAPAAPEVQVPEPAAASAPAAASTLEERVQETAPEPETPAVASSPAPFDDAPPFPDFSFEDAGFPPFPDAPPAPVDDLSSLFDDAPPFPGVLTPAPRMEPETPPAAAPVEERPAPAPVPAPAPAPADAPTAAPAPVAGTGRAIPTESRRGGRRRLSDARTPEPAEEPTPVLGGQTSLQSVPWETAAPQVSTRAPRPSGPADPEPAAPAPQFAPQLTPQLAPRPRATPLTGAVLRPELFPSSVSKTRRRAPAKSVRTRAAAPDKHLFDVPTDAVAEGEPVTDEQHQALLAAVCVPQPVFTSDLVALTGSPDLVRNWEDQCRSSAASKVRFIGARQRHEGRGALVLPADDLRRADPDLERSYWSQCVERYRGPQLYELAVLLQAVSKEVVSCHPGEHTMTLRLLGRSGASSAHGIVVVVGSKLAADGATRQALADELEEILSERLARVTVLTTKVETYEPMTKAVSEEAQTRKWGPSMPVLGARSWEYAANPDAVNEQLLRA